jgi:FlaA1/EpsC-like NDP-sugar epimerase
MRYKFLSRTTQQVLDLVILSIAFLAAYMLRFDGMPEGLHLKKMVFQLPYMVAFQFIIFLFLGNYNYVWKYFSSTELQRFFLALAIPPPIFFLFRIWAPHPYLIIPISIVIMDGLLAFLGTSGVRYLRRRIFEHRSFSVGKKSPRREFAILIGAGSAGVLVARELQNNPAVPYKAIGFVDDDPLKKGTVIQGLTVYGQIKDIGRIARERSAALAIITIANISSDEIVRMANACEKAGLKVKIVPPFAEFFDERSSLLRIREVSFEDLLGREAVTLDREAIKEIVVEQTVLVTGAGGSIGSEICRQLCRFKPQKLVLLERAENPLFYVNSELQETFPGIEIIACVGDVGDRARVDEIFEEHRPAAVFHAAAHKHVPLMEDSPNEAIKNNVFGTRTVAEAADRWQVNKFVMISTDKAVRPSSIMGATKRAAEIFIQTLSERSKTKFITVRFGNVLGSAGSVLTVFKEQIKKGGPVTITHPEMSRYFMTISEASLLVLQAASMGEGGEIFILDMGKPIRIVEMVEEYIRLSGLKVGEDIQVVFTGPRPGEKLHEELYHEQEQMDKTRHPKIFIGRIVHYEAQRVDQFYEDLKNGTNHRATVINKLQKLIPEFIPPVAPEDRRRTENPASGE